MPHLGPVDTGEGSGEGAADEGVIGEGDAAFAALADTAEADTPSFNMAATALPTAASLAAAELDIAAAFAALTDAAEADAPWFNMAAIPLPIAAPFAAAVDIGTSEVAVTPRESVVWVLASCPAD